MMMNCPKCNAPTRMQVQAVISAPGELTRVLSKRNLCRKDVYLMGVLWETADYICTNEVCQYIVDGYGNYVTSLEAERDRLRTELDALKNREPVVTKQKNGIVLHAGWDDLPEGAKLYAAAMPPSVPDFADAYQGAMEDLAIWKKRALEAEALNRKFMAEINGPTHMGEPVATPPSVPHVTEEMITAYLTANDAYWKECDELPKSPVKWRHGTPSEATRISLEAALAAAPKPEE